MSMPETILRDGPRTHQKHSHVFFRLLRARLCDEPRSTTVPCDCDIPLAFYHFGESGISTRHAQSRIGRQTKLPARLLPGGDRAKLR